MSAATRLASLKILLAHIREGAPAQVHSLRAHLYLRLGRLADAETDGRTALEIFDQIKLGRQRVVTLAVTAGRPSATSVGNVIKLPPPATALIAPAAIDVAATIAMLAGSIIP